MKEKVYCGKCKYFDSAMFIHICSCKKNPYVVENPIKKENRFQKCIYINKNNDCKDFKKRWFK